MVLDIPDSPRVAAPGEPRAVRGRQTAVLDAQARPTGAGAADRLEPEPPGRRTPAADTQSASACGATSRRCVRVVVCDDHAVVRAGLKRLLDSIDGIDVVGIAADGEEGLEVAARLRPDVVLMDLSMPRLDGVAATRNITTVVPDTRVVVLTSFHHRARVANAIEAGASGYVLKDATPAELLHAIRAASGDARSARTAR
jgi:CheY-like chemotaxis protein